VKIKVGDKVKVLKRHYEEWKGRTGKVVAIVKVTFEKTYQEYIVQFSDTWSYFKKNEIKKEAK